MTQVIFLWKTSVTQVVFPGRIYLQADVKQSGRDCSEPANDQKDGEDLQVLTTLSSLDDVCILS